MSTSIWYDTSIHYTTAHTGGVTSSKLFSCLIYPPGGFKHHTHKHTSTTKPPNTPRAQRSAGGLKYKHMEHKNTTEPPRYTHNYKTHEETIHSQSLSPLAAQPAPREPMNHRLPSPRQQPCSTRASAKTPSDIISAV